MPDYGITEDKYQIISGSAYLFRSGALSDSSTSISASTSQIIAITCSSNLNNRLTPPNNTSSYSIINLNSGSQSPQRLVLRYISGSYNSDGTILSNTPNKLLYKSKGPKDTYVNVPLLNNDDSLAVAYKTVNSLTTAGGYGNFYSASLIPLGTDDQTTTGVGSIEIENDFIIGTYPGGTGLSHYSSSLGVNQTIGSTFRVRAGEGIGDLSIGGNFIVDEYTHIGKFLFQNLKSGSVSSADFSGSMVEVGGMMVGSSFKIGGSTQLFTYNTVQTGSGNTNQPFFEGNKITSNASIGLILDPNDKSSGLITGSGDAKLYMSSSGRIGMGTTNPQTDFDIAADKFQVRAKRDSKGIFVNEEGNLESFNKTTAGASTGSEFIMSYARGGSANITPQMVSVVLFGASNPALTGYPFSADAQEETNNIIADFDDLANFIEEFDPGVIAEATHLGEKIGLLGTNAQADDILGSLRWIADSGSFDSKYFNNRGSGEMLKIQGRVSEATDFGIKGDMIFYATTDVAQPPTEIMRIASNGNVHITGSLKVSGTVDSVGVDTDGTSTIDGGSF